MQFFKCILKLPSYPNSVTQKLNTHTHTHEQNYLYTDHQETQPLCDSSSVTSGGRRPLPCGPQRGQDSALPWEGSLEEGPTQSHLSGGKHPSTGRMGRCTRPQTNPRVREQTDGRRQESEVKPRPELGPVRRLSLTNS